MYNIAVCDKDKKTLKLIERTLNRLIGKEININVTVFEDCSEFLSVVNNENNKKETDESFSKWEVENQDFNPEYVGEEHVFKFGSEDSNPFQDMEGKTEILNDEQIAELCDSGNEQIAEICDSDVEENDELCGPEIKQSKESCYFYAVFVNVGEAAQESVDTINEIRKILPDLKVIYMTDNLDNCEVIFDNEFFFFIKKPASKDRVCEAVMKIKNKMKKGQTRLLVRLNSLNKVIVKTDDIVFVESKGHKMYIHTLDGIYSMYKKLDDLERALGNSFLRCHKSYLINMKHIQKKTYRCITVTTGERLNISRTKVAEVKKKLADFVNGPVMMD